MQAPRSLVPPTAHLATQHLRLVQLGGAYLALAGSEFLGLSLGGIKLPKLLCQTL